VDAVRKAPGEVVRHSRDFLMKFAARYTTCPQELASSGLEVLLTDDRERDVQRKVLQSAADDADDRDWRTRPLGGGPEEPRLPTPAALAPAPRPAEKAERAAPAPAAARPAPAAAAPAAQPAPKAAQQPAAAAAAQPQQQPARASPAPSPAAQPPQQRDQAPYVDTSKFAKAADVGLQAYKPGGNVSGTERALRQIKGVLNKLTPEKFDRLLNQLLEVVATADVLKHTIAMVFENAVAQPTFVAMYADLCLALSRELPQFPPAAGEDKPMTFKRVLLNTCQDEFEEAAAAREALRTIREPDEREAAERRVKQRTLGNVRLIAELYRKDVVTEKIVHLCVRDLLEPVGTGKDALPHEDSIEAVCEMVSISGKKLADGGSEEGRKRLRGYLGRMEKLAASAALPARLRFIVREVLELERSKWVPRRETFTARKISEVKAEAQAELGMTDYDRIVSELPSLPAQHRFAAEEVALLPPLRSAAAGNGGGNDGFGRGGLPGMRGPLPGSAGTSGRPPAAPAPATPPAKAPAARAAAGAPAKPLSAEEVEAKVRSLVREYVSVGDAAEAVTCGRELEAGAGAAAAGKALVQFGLEEALDAVRERDQGAVLGLLAALAAAGLVGPAQLAAGLGAYAENLEDVALDYPAAPGLLGRFAGAALATGALELPALAAMLAGVESARPRRELIAVALNAVKAAKGDAGLAAVCKGFSAAAVLAVDADIDGDEEPPAAAFLKQHGLSAVPL